MFISGTAFVCELGTLDFVLTRGHWGERRVRRLRLHEREAFRALWRGHFEGWRLGRTDAARILPPAWPIAEELRKRHGQLKHEDVAGRDSRWARHPRLRHMVSPMATAMANEAADRVPAVVTRTGADVKSAKRTSDASSSRTRAPGQSLRRWDPATGSTCAYCSNGGGPWRLADQLRRQASRRGSDG